MSPYYCHLTLVRTRQNALWWFCRGCSPLPIPNREVKPLMADGTAQKCGRVGSCHIYLLKPLCFITRGFFYVSYFLSSSSYNNEPSQLISPSWQDGTAQKMCENKCLSCLFKRPFTLLEMFFLYSEFFEI